MPQAQITINGTPGSDTDLPIGTPVLLANNGIGGETTYAWTILDQPPGTADVLSSSASPNPTFTPTKEGSYLIRLVVNQTQPSETMDQVVAAVLQVRSRMRQPAAGETDEVDTADGWAQSANTNWRRLDDILSAPGSCVAQVASGSPAVNSVVSFSSDATILAGLPGEKKLLAVTPALATSATVQTADIGVVLDAVDDGSISAGALIYVRTQGLVSGVALTGAVVGDLVYVDDTGSLSLTAGTVDRVIGRVVAVPSGTTADVYVGTFAATFAGNPKRFATYVVGNSAEGDTANDCDYLDPGNGSGILAALAAAYTTPGRIIVRRGAYALPATWTPPTIPGNTILEGEGQWTIIVAPAGDVATLPWRAFVLGGAGAEVRDLLISIPDRNPLALASTSPLPVIAVDALNTAVRRVVVQIAGPFAVSDYQLSAIHFANPDFTMGGQVFEDVTLDMTYATVTGHATNPIAACLCSSGSVMSPSVMNALPEGRPEPIYTRCKVTGGKTNAAAVPPYLTVGAAHGLALEATFVNCDFDGVIAGYIFSLSASAGAWTSRGPRVVGGTVRGAAATSGFFVQGFVVLASQAGGTITLDRVHVKGMESIGPTTGSMDPGVYVHGDATLRDVLIEGCTLQANSVTPTSASVTVTAGAINLYEDVRILNNVCRPSDPSVNGNIAFSSCDGAIVMANTVDTIDVGTGNTSANVSINRVRTVAGITDFGTLTSQTGNTFG